MSVPDPAVHLREIGLVAARQDVDHPWVDHVWTPHAALAEAPATSAGTLLSRDAGSALHYLGASMLELYPSETANYRDNLHSGDPRLWVACRAAEDAGVPQLVRVTADPTEGEALFECGTDIVGTVPMPQPIAEWLAEFVATFHVERVFLKRQRDRGEKPGPRRGGQGSGRDDRS
ncbi:MAG: molybdopterin-guanine dinucleotide biosynthesis protein [Hyphomicrobiales bacterium]|nr:molybdopterin-guanine dinucleotide biosynthesis protein [Hyphomicrobiales bacterium]